MTDGGNFQEDDPDLDDEGWDGAGTEVLEDCVNPEHKGLGSHSDDDTPSCYGSAREGVYNGVALEKAAPGENVRVMLGDQVLNVPIMPMTTQHGNVTMFRIPGGTVEARVVLTFTPDSAPVPRVAKCTVCEAPLMQETLLDSRGLRHADEGICFVYRQIVERDNGNLG